MWEGNKNLGIPKSVQFGLEIFTISSAAYITVDFKKLASDLFHAGFLRLSNAVIKIVKVIKFFQVDIRTFKIRITA